MGRDHDTNSILNTLIIGEVKSYCRGEKSMLSPGLFPSILPSKVMLKKFSNVQHTYRPQQ